MNFHHTEKYQQNKAEVDSAYFNVMLWTPKKI